MCIQHNDEMNFELESVRNRRSTINKYNDDTIWFRTRTEAGTSPMMGRKIKLRPETRRTRTTTNEQRQRRRRWRQRFRTPPIRFWTALRWWVRWEWLTDWMRWEGDLEQPYKRTRTLWQNTVTAKHINADGGTRAALTRHENHPSADNYSWNIKLLDSKGRNVSRVYTTTD